MNFGGPADESKLEQDMRVHDYISTCKKFTKGCDYFARARLNGSFERKLYTWLDRARTTPLPNVNAFLKFLLSLNEKKYTKIKDPLARAFFVAIQNCMLKNFGFEVQITHGDDSAFAYKQLQKKMSSTPSNIRKRKDFIRLRPTEDL